MNCTNLTELPMLGCCGGPTTGFKFHALWTSRTMNGIFSRALASQRGTVGPDQLRQLWGYRTDFAPGYTFDERFELLRSSNEIREIIDQVSPITWQQIIYHDALLDTQDIQGQILVLNRDQLIPPTFQNSEMDVNLLPEGFPSGIGQLRQSFNWDDSIQILAGSDNFHPEITSTVAAWHLTRDRGGTINEVIEFLPDLVNLGITLPANVSRDLLIWNFCRSFVYGYKPGDLGVPLWYGFTAYISKCRIDTDGSFAVYRFAVDSSDRGTPQIYSSISGNVESFYFMPEFGECMAFEEIVSPP